MAEFSKAGLSLRAALQAVKKMHSVPRQLRSVASEIEQQLEAGTSFSLALAQCTAVSFTPVYVAFVSAAQETGLLSETFAFLLKREEQYEVRRNAIVSACVYPFLVVVAACVGSFLLLKYGALFVVSITGKFDEAAYRVQALAGVAKATGFLFSFAVVGVLSLKKKLGVNTKLDLFRALSFLTASGIDLVRALETALPVVRNESSWERKVMKLLDDLQKGKPVGELFASFGTACEIAVETAQNEGSLSTAFAHIVAVEEEKEKVAVKRCIDFVEPSVMCAVAVYLIILLKATVMPVLYGYGL